jgi:peptidoglycan-N-acetylglucosamine deacetylase
MTSPSKPKGTLQVDVDDLWVYYESIGRTTPHDAEPAAFTQGIPRLLDLFDRYGARGTFFVCGRDLPAQRKVIREIVRRGHEVANHSAKHRNGYARLSYEALWQDVCEAHGKIAEATGRAPVGFKAPGFSYNPLLPRVLAELGYRYDSSRLPTFYAGAIRGMQRVLSKGEVDPTHYGRFSYGLESLRPHPLDTGSALLEAPVTTVPIVRLPMHSTFVLTAGRWLFDLGMWLCRARSTPVNYLLHAADVVDLSSGGTTPDPALASYPFLTQPWSRKRPLYEHMLSQLTQTYVVVPTQEFVNFEKGRT